MPKTWTLVSEAGVQAIVFPPPILTRRKGRTKLLSIEVRQWHEALLKAISSAKLPVWTPEEADPFCFAHAGQFYRKLEKLLELEISVHELAADSRHRFFVCTDAIDQGNDTVVQGLSGLEQIMGYQLLFKQTVQAAQKTSRMASTGSQELDVLTTGLLIFKRKGWELGFTLGTEDYNAMNRLASEMMRSSDDDDAPQDEEQEDDSPDNAVLLKQKTKVLEALAVRGVIPPEGF